MIEKVLHIGPALYVQGGISSVLVSYKKLFGLPDKNFIASYNGSFVKSLPMFLRVCLRLLLCPPKGFDFFQIHTSSYGSFFRKFIISLCLRLRSKKYTVHIHGSLFDKFCAGANPLVRKMLNSYFSHASRIFILSREMRDIVLSVAPHVNQFEVIPNPCEFVPEKPVNLQNHLEPVKIVFSGRYGKRKGVYDLLESFEKANFKVPVQLFLFGDGEVDKVKSAVDASSKKDFIEMSAWRKHDEYLKILPDFDLLVLPSYAERFSMSLVEAQGLGLPVISTFVGGTADIVEDGVTGLLCNAGDVDVLARNLERLVNDRNLRLQMGAAGWERIRTHYTGDVVLQKLETEYNALAL